jgi:hypothetical protein
LRILNQKLKLSIICCVLLAAPGVLGFTRAAGYGYPAADSSENSSEWAFLPSAALLVDSEFYAENDAGYTMILHRVIGVDVLRYSNIVLSFSVNEGIRYKDTDSNYLYPYLIRNQMDFVNLRWELPQGSLSWFIDHSCNNNINEDVAGSRRVRWYGTGLGWETNGMRLGHRNTGITFGKAEHFEILNIINYGFSAAKSLSTRYNNYTMIARGALRYDPLRYYFLIPYIEGSLEALVEDRVKIDRALEAGMRISLLNVDITPYVGYRHRHDLDLDNMRAVDLYLIGFRLEALVGGERWQEERDIKMPLLLPGIHFSGGYGYLVLDEYLYFNSDILFEVDLIRIENLTVFLNNRLSHNSSSKRKGLYPRYLYYIAESGLSYDMHNLRAYVEPFYRYGRFDEGNYYRGYNEQFQMIGLRLKSRGMEIGDINYGIGFGGGGGFEWLNSINWLVSAGRTVHENNYCYDWDCQLKLRWDILRYWVIIPYLSGAVRFIRDESSVWEYSTETGVRLHFGLDLMLFHQYHYRTEPDISNGFDGQFHLVGVRLEI